MSLLNESHLSQFFKLNQGNGVILTNNSLIVDDSLIFHTLLIDVEVFLHDYDSDGISQGRNVRTVIKASGVWGYPAIYTTKRTARFSTDNERPYMSLLTMVGPSPDWCIGKYFLWTL